jgi:hypothetical protein
MPTSTHPFTDNLYCWVSLAGVACNSVALMDKHGRWYQHNPMCAPNWDAHLVALDLGLTVMYDFINFPRDIAGTPFPSVNSHIQLARLYDNHGEYARNILSCLQRFALGFAHDESQCKVWKYGDGWNANRRFMEARSVNYVIQ